ncbi:hypothetical protein K431DRAFT_37231 [Polychaeton citri CBS 116435]|uniref:Uncharacterized protein n=1 Tax=Polychaeton citri CBS 116435 TaxID=1314669 RepID=A0A9P4QDT2_9PEZI|nr:hypothetical protein K431DRAFT_37231 [Polychaeton citri CBS 116435]
MKVTRSVLVLAGLARGSLSAPAIMSVTRSASEIMSRRWHTQPIIRSSPRRTEQDDGQAYQPPQSRIMVSSASRPPSKNPETFSSHIKTQRHIQWRSEDSVDKSHPTSSSERRRQSCIAESGLSTYQHQPSDPKGRLALNQIAVGSGGLQYRSHTDEPRKLDGVTRLTFWGPPDGREDGE